MRHLLTIILLILAGPGLAADSFPVSDGQGAAPDVAALSDSTAVFVYESNGKVHFRLMPGGDEAPLALPGPGEESAPAVSSFPDGGFVAAWLSDDGTGKTALVRYFDAAGVPGADPFPAAGGGGAEDVAVAAMPGGGCVATVSRFGPPGWENVLARIHGANSEPVSPVYEVSEAVVVYNVHPRVAVAPGGGFTIVWGTFLNPDAAVRARSHTGIGDAWNDPWPVAADAAFPTVAIDREGGWLMAWTATSGRSDIRARREGYPEISVGGSGAGTPAMAMHPDGGAVIAWHENDTGSSGVLRARILDNEGQPDGDVFTVALWTEGSGETPGAAVSAEGRIVFTWVDGITGKITGTWWGDPLVPVANNNWGSLKSAWR